MTRLPPRSTLHLVWRSSVSEISSSRTPVTSEFGRCPRRARSPLWREMELFVPAGAADPRLPLSFVLLAQLVWRAAGPGKFFFPAPFNNQIWRGAPRGRRSPLGGEGSFFFLG